MLALAHALEHALERALAALASNDAAAASEALQEANSACAQAERQGLRLAPDALARIRELHHKGADTAQRAAGELARALESAGSARRAASAYRR